MTRESRKFQSSQQTDDNQGVYVERIYIPDYSSFWRGLTALSILCDEGNARAYESRMGRETDTYAFFVS